MKNYIIVTVCVSLLVLVGVRFYVDSLKQEDQRALEGAQRVQENIQRIQENKKLTDELSATKDRLSAVEKTKVEPTAADIVNEWKPQVVRIVCSWYYTDGTFSSASGSGFLTTFTDNSIAVITNKHVIFDETGHDPEFCITHFLNGDQYTTLWGADFSWSVSYDKAGIVLLNLKESTKSLIKRTTGYYCGKRPAIGDKIVVLGYPGIGSDSGITATEGIVSGYDRDYYIVSAKIDHGDSGGIAVSVKGDCIMGMVTLAISGKIESLGRVLSSEAILKSDK